MLGLALLFLVIALIAYFMGAGQVGAVAVDIAKWLFFIAILLIVLSFIFGAFAPGPYWGWPFPLYR
jgi:uncharacterized membrane protein YtjA (UPF0391 family)